MHDFTRGTAQDVNNTDQLRQRIRELEEQLADREQKLQEIQYANQDMADMIDRIGDVFFAVDREWRYLYVNPKAAALAGVHSDNLLGKTLWETFPQLLGTIYEKEYRRAMEQQIPVVVEERGVISGRWYETLVYPSDRGLSFYGRDITTRKLAQEALRENQEQTERQLAELKAVYATAPAGLCYLDTDLRYINISDRLAHWAGVTPADLIGRKMDEVFDRTSDEIPSNLRRAIETGEPIVNQEYQAPLSGDPAHMRDWLLNYYPVRDSSDKVIGVNAVVQDVTEWKQLQSEREEALALLDAFFSLAPIGLAFVDEKFRFVRVNEALASMNGLPIQEHLHKRPDELPLSITNLSEMLQIWKRMMNEGKSVRGMEVSGETPAAPGVTRYWLENWYPVRIQERTIGIGVVVEEITERKLYEQSLQQSEERFRHLADSLPQLVWTANSDGKVDYYNQRRQEFQGITKTTDGWDWSPVIHPDDLAVTIKAWQKAVETGSVYVIEHRVCRANGEFEWYLSRAVPMRNAKGQIHKWYGTATNIHESRVAAAERERLLAALERERAQLKELAATLEDRVYQGTEQIRT
jgi:PAS domain S-box-containing protein